MKIHFTRHGESEANISRIISNRNLPHHLTDAGRVQAESLAQRLVTIPITRIYSSPIHRAVETAEIVKMKLNIPLEKADALREPDCGVLEGRSDACSWLAHDFWKKAWFAGLLLDHGPRRGETFRQVQSRFVTFIDGLKLLSSKSDEEFLIVTHGALLLIGLPAVLEGVGVKTLKAFGLGHTVLISTELFPDSLLRIDRIEGNFADPH